METLRTALQRRLASLDALAAGKGQTGAFHPGAAQGVRNVLDRLVLEGAEMARPEPGWSEAERRLMGVLSRAIRIRRGQCYANAQRLLLAAGRLEIPHGHDLGYCEGYAQFPHLAAPFAHAWCLLNGHVWDPTLDRLNVPVSYLGLTLPTDFVFFALHHRGRLGPLLSEWCTPAGAQRSSIERTLRVRSAVGPRQRLGHLTARL